MPTSVELARATSRTIRQNLFGAFAYNTAAIPPAAAGLLDPMIAAAARWPSSVSAVSNALRLRGFGAGQLELLTDTGSRLERYRYNGSTARSYKTWSPRRLRRLG